MKLRNKIAAGAALAMFTMLPTAVEYAVMTHLGQHVATDGTIIVESGTPATVDGDGTIIVES